VFNQNANLGATKSNPITRGKGIVVQKKKTICGPNQKDGTSSREKHTKNPLGIQPPDSKKTTGRGGTEHQVKSKIILTAPQEKKDRFSQTSSLGKGFGPSGGGTDGGEGREVGQREALEQSSRRGGQKPTPRDHGGAISASRVVTLPNCGP